ncbi:peptidase domain protein [Limnospira maxima CS-328]|uniref:Peptidase domain protein n=2 Tax=Limnospira maxima TaxID=129910 RepID=B5WA84_LIMMA|nr:peptidase domain protein [Limnospira maxima CS-328]
MYDEVYISFYHSDGDLDLALYNEQGELVDSSTGTSDWESISLEGLSSGTYYAQVYGYGGATNNYEMGIYAYGDWDYYPDYGWPYYGEPNDYWYEPNDTMATAYDLGVVYSWYDWLSIDPVGDEDWFRFELPSTGGMYDEIYISFYHSDGDLDLALYNEQGELVDSSTGTSDWESISLEGLSSGTYYVQVYGHDGATNNYSMGIYAYGDWDYYPDYGWPYYGEPNDYWYEPNDTMATAYDLGVVYSWYDWLSIDPVGDEDWFRFELPSTGGMYDEVYISFYHSDGDLDLALYNEQGELVDSSTGTSDWESISLEGLPSGTYYAQVYGYGGATNNYEMGIYAYGDWDYYPDYGWPYYGEPNDYWYEPNDTMATAYDLGVVYSWYDWLSIDPVGDEDWFRFELPSTGGMYDEIYISFYHGDGDLDLALYNEQGELVDSSTGTSDWESISLEGLSSGTYYAQVYGYGGATNNYEMGIYAYGDWDYYPDYGWPYYGEPNDYWYEPNDTMATAYDLGVVYSWYDWLSIDPVGDEDWFRFELPSTGGMYDEVYISFYHSDGDLDLALYNEQGELVDSSTGTSDWESISLEGLSSGTYYAQVYGYGGATNNYEMGIYAYGDWDYYPDYGWPYYGEPNDYWYEPNDTMATAYDLGVVYSWYDWLSIDPVGDEDWFRFELPSTGGMYDEIYISFYHSDGDLDLALYNEQGELVDSSTGTSDWESISLEGLSSGTYYVQVYGHDGATNNYSMGIYAYGDWDYYPDYGWPYYGEPNDYWYEPNDTMATAYDLGVVYSWYDWLSIDPVGDEDWFRFELPSTGGMYDEVYISFYHSDGDLDLALYNEQGELVDSSTGTSDWEALA